jgi:hypothetical protein
MPFVRGQKKPVGSGIKKGSKHIKTTQWDTLGNYLVNEGLDRFLEYLKNVHDKTYAEYYMRLIEYFKPKVMRVNSSVNEKEPLIIKIIESTISDDEIEKSKNKEE